MTTTPKGKDSAKGKDGGDDKKSKQAMSDLGDVIDDLEAQVQKISKLQAQASKGDADKVAKPLETEIKTLKKLVDQLEKAGKEMKS